MEPKDQDTGYQSSYSQQERMKLAGVLLGAFVILSVVVISLLGFWVWFLLCLALVGGVAYLYIYQPEKFTLYTPKVLQLTDETATTLQTTSVKVKDTVYVYGVKAIDKAQTEYQSRFGNAKVSQGADVMTTQAPMIMPDAVNPTEVSRHTIKICVPKSTKWEADKALRFMEGLYSIPTPLVLSIRATDLQISWFIEVTNDHKTAVINVIQAHYPQATIESQPKTKLDLGYYLFQIEVDTPSFAPFAEVSRLKSHDPLTGFIASMNNLQPGEEFVYEVVLYRPTYNYTELAEQFLVKPLEVSWIHLLNDNIRNEVLTRQATGQNKIEIFPEEIAAAIKHKAMQQCQSANFSVKIKASSAARADSIYNSFINGITVFDNIPLNLMLTAKENETYPLLLTAGEAAAIWHLPSADIQTTGVDWSRGIVTPLPNQLIALSQKRTAESIVLGTNTYQGRTHDVRLTYYDRVPHVNIVGRNRVGKSTLMHHMIHQDIQNGKGVGVIDPHGRLVHDILRSSIPPERAKDVILFDVQDKEFPIGMNLFKSEGNIPPEKHASFVVGVLRKIFEDVWSTGRTEDVISACINSLVTYPGATIFDVPRLLLDAGYRYRVLKQVKDPVSLDFWKFEYDKKSESGQLQFAQPVNNKLRRLFRDPDLRRILCQQRSLNFREIMDSNKIFLASLGGMSTVEAETLGALIMSKIQMAAESRGQNPPSVFYFYVDEVQNFITTSLSEILSEVAKFGLSMVIANQFLRQLEGATLNAVLGNVGSTVIFRVGVQDAHLLSSSVKPVTAEDLENLDRFNTVVKMQVDGQTLPAFSMMTLPPLPLNDEADATIEDIQNRTRDNYATPSHEVDKELEQRYGDDDSDERYSDDPDDPDSNAKSNGGYSG